MTALWSPPGCRQENAALPLYCGATCNRSQCSVAYPANKLSQTPGHSMHVLGARHWRIADFDLYPRSRSTLLVAPRTAAEPASLEGHGSEPHSTGDDLMVVVGLRYDVIATRRRLAQSASGGWCPPPIGRHHWDDPASRRLQWLGCRREREQPFCPISPLTKSALDTSGLV